MKHLLISTAAVALLSGAAVAADLPVYEPAPVIAPVPVGFTWSGIYIGASIGGYWGGGDDGGIEFCDDPLEAKIDGNGDAVGELEGILDDLEGVFVSYCEPDEVTDDGADGTNDGILFEEFDDGEGDDDDFGFLANVHIGVNAQTGRFVFGAEGEVKWLFGNDEDDEEVGFVIFDDVEQGDPDLLSDPDGSGFISSNGDSLDWLGLATLRGGVVLGARNQALAYVKGGLAISEGGGGLSGDCEINEGQGPDLEFCRVIGDDDDDDDWNIGWTLGGGLEYKLTQNFSIGAEYLYVDLNNDGGGSALIEYQDNDNGEVRELEVSSDDDGDNLHLVEIRASFHF